MVSEETVLPVLRKIDSYYVNRNITSDEADDLTKCIMWVIGKSKNESNIQQVIAPQLRSYKEFIDERIVSSVINEFRRVVG